MSRLIWDGKGQLPAGAAYWELMSGPSRGTLVGRDYIRSRALKFLARYCADMTPAARRGVVARTVGDDEWLGSRNGMIVQAVCWDVYLNSMTGGPA